MNRKIIAIFTALLLAASLCACNNGNKGDESTTEDNRIEIPSGEDTTAEDTTKGDDQTTESESGAVVDNFEECNDTVYILVSTGAANLRKSPSMNDSAIATSIVNGTELERVAVSSDGWSKVNYNDETYYIKTSCIISASDLEGFVSASGTVTLSGSFNVRIAPNGNNDAVGTLAAGDTIEVIAVNETTGWYKINFEGTYYTGEAYVYIDSEYMEGEVVVNGTEDTTAADTTTATAEDTTVVEEE